jgi:actin-related protein 6
MGIVEAIVESIRCCPSELHEPLYGNVVLIGGNVLFRGFKERVESELRQLAPADFAVRVIVPEDPVIAAWRGAALYAGSALLPQLAVTKREWDEFGFTICKRKFIIS